MKYDMKVTTPMKSDESCNLNEIFDEIYNWNGFCDEMAIAMKFWI